MSVIADDPCGRAAGRLAAVRVAVQRRRCAWLLGALVALLALHPYVGEGGLIGVALEVLVSAVLLTGLYAVSRGRRQALVAVALLAPSLLGTWAGVGPPVAFVTVTCEIAFLVFVAATIFGLVLNGRLESAERLQGALSVYFLIGVLFASVYELLELCVPGSVTLPGGEPQWTDLLYFSFATLTTLGYGDVLPATAGARSLAMIETSAGVLYLAVLVAWLVSALGPAGGPARPADGRATRRGS